MSKLKQDDINCLSIWTSFVWINRFFNFQLFCLLSPFYIMATYYLVLLHTWKTFGLLYGLPFNTVEFSVFSLRFISWYDVKCPFISPHWPLLAKMTNLVVSHHLLYIIWDILYKLSYQTQYLSVAFIWYGVLDFSTYFGIILV